MLISSLLCSIVLVSPLSIGGSDNKFAPTPLAGEAGREEWRGVALDDILNPAKSVSDSSFMRSIT